MKPSRLAVVLDKLLDTRWPAFIWGPPGVGKSSIVRAIAQSRNLPVIDLRASLLDPTDLRGIPAIENRQAVWCPPSFLPRADDEKGVLFLDEINAAPPLVQAALYQLVLDRRVGEYELPAGWRIVAAGNRAEDRAVVFRLSSALANRFVHLDFEVNFDDWRTWAIGAKVHPLVVGFLGLRRELLLEADTAQVAFPTPRSWEMVSDVLKQFAAPERCKDLLPGVIGEGAAAEFLSYTKRALREEDFMAIVAKPATATLPAGIGDVYALVSWIVKSAEEPDMQASSAVLLGRLPPEFGVMLAKEMISAMPSFVAQPGYREFVRKHGDLLAG